MCAPRVDKVGLVLSGIMDDTDRWADPELPAKRRRRTRYRLGGGVVGLVAGLLVFGSTILSLGPLLWPPGGPRWLTLVLVVGLSLMLPLMIGAWVGETYGRRSNGGASSRD